MTPPSAPGVTLDRNLDEESTSETLFVPSENSPTEPSARNLIITPELESSQSTVEATEAKTATAYVNYLQLGREDSFEHDLAKVALIEQGLNEERVSYQYARGWLQVETAKMISHIDQDGAIRLLENARDSWDKAWKLSTLDEEAQSNLVDGYRALTAAASITYLQAEVLGREEAFREDYYEELVRVGTHLLREFDEKRYASGLENLAGFVQEFTVLLSMARLQKVHRLRMNTFLAPPRQENAEPKKKLGEGEVRVKYSWDVNVFHEKEVGHLQVKNYIKPGRDVNTYKPEITGIKLICGSENLDNHYGKEIINGEEQAKKRFPLMRSLIRESTDGTTDAQRIESAEVELLVAIEREDLAFLINRERAEIALKRVEVKKAQRAA